MQSQAATAASRKNAFQLFAMICATFRPAPSGLDRPDGLRHTPDSRPKRGDPRL